MNPARVVLGLVLLSVGIVMIAGFRRIGERAARRGAAHVALPILWLFLGTLLATNGVLQLVLALA